MTPYGYKIEQGHAVLDPDAAPKVKAFFRHYLDGLPVEPACIAAKVDRVPHSSWKLLTDKRYMGDDFYPPIIDRDTFERVQEERKLRNHNPAQSVHYELLPGAVATNFRMKRVNCLPQNVKLIPQVLYDCIQPYAGRQDGDGLDPDERERLLFHIGYAMDLMPEAPVVTDAAT